MYYTINEETARRANDMNSMSDYKAGSATAHYRSMIDEAQRIADKQKKRVDAMYHGKIDSLLDTYARKLADNLNKHYSIEASCVSILISGGGNFPTRKKEKQNAARDNNMQEYNHIQDLLDKIQSVGTGGVSSDDTNAVAKIEAKVKQLEAWQAKMKVVNAYYRKHKTLEGCKDISTSERMSIESGMANSWRSEPKPFESYELSNNNANIKRYKQRLDELKKHAETEFPEWSFDGGKIEANKEANRLQIFFDDKPDADMRSALKSNGFRWAPSIGAWQRQLNNNAYYAIKRIDALQPTA